MDEKVTAIIDILKEVYPQAPCALQYKKDYELMISVRLAAQCTDARVNQITPALFAAYPTLEAMAAADIADVENYVRSCGFYRHKARDIVLSCQKLIADFGGKVPGTMEELVSLRLCYERYTPVFLRLSHGSTPEELHTLLDTCQLSGVDGVVVPTLSMIYKVRELTLGRVPVICQIQDVEEGLMALHEGVSLLEAKPGFKGLNKLLKMLEKQ